MKNFESQLRLGTGLILALYVVQHLVNHSFGIVSIEAAEAYRQTVGALFQNLPGQVLLYGSLLFHATIADCRSCRWWLGMQSVIGALTCSVKSTPIISTLPLL
jgi:hypothetical protein